jgi:Flp pilus assembly protein CpaB
VAVVTRDLPAGHRLQTGDAGSVDVPTALVPKGALATSRLPVGRHLAAPMRAGELLTDLSVVSPTALQTHPEGSVLATVRITDPAATEAVDVGDRVSVIAADLREAGAAKVVARRVIVVSLPGGDPGGGLGQGAPVVLAVDEPTALALADATVGGALSLVLTE